MSSEKETFLKRIHSINGYKTGSVLSVDMHGGTILLGKNGMGKTTVLRLTLLFFGSSPAEITKKDGANKSFIDYNLPTDSSYLVFEYMKQGKPLMVVAYRQSSTTNVAYRFLEGEFDESIFYTENSGKRLILENSALPKTLTILGIPHSSQFGHRDYKEILQSGIKVSGATKESRKINETKAQYSFCGYNKSIAGTEKVGHSTLENTASFSAIKSLIANGVMGINDRNIATPPRFSSDEMNKGRETLSDAKRFQNHSGLVREMGEFKALMDDERLELGVLKSKAIASFEFHESLVATLSEQVNKKHLLLESNKTSFNSQESAHTTAVNGLTYKLEKLSGDLQAIVDTETEYSSMNIESKKILAGRVVELEKELKDVEAELADLTKGHKRVTAKYVQMGVSAKEKAQDEIDGLTVKKDAQLAEFESRVEAIRLKKDAALDAFHESKSQEALSIQTEIAETKGAVALLKLSLKNPESEGIERARSASTSLAQEQSDLEGDYSKAKDKLQQLKDTTQDVSDECGSLADECRKAESDLQSRNDYMEELVAQKEASEDTLFHQIKAYSPVMFGTALKVLTRDALLTISPGLVFRDNNTPLSFDLDCSKLESQEFYDEDELKKKIDQTGRDVERLEAIVANLTGQINTLTGVVLANQKSISALEASVNIALKKRNNKIDEVGKAQLTLDVELESEKNRLEELILIESDKHQTAESKSKKFTIDKDQEKASLIKVYDGKLQAEANAKRSASDQYDGNVKAIRARLDKKLQNIQTSLNADLSDAGVQESELERLGLKIDGVSGELEDARQAEAIVKEFMDWSRDVLSRRPGIELDIQTDGEKLKLMVEEFESVKQEYLANQKELQGSHDALEGRLNASSSELQNFDWLISNELSSFSGSTIFKIEGMPPLAHDIKISYQVHKSREREYFSAGQKCYTRLANALRDMTTLNKALRGLLLQEGIRDIDDSSRWYEYVYAFDLIMNNFLQQEIDLVEEKFARIGVDFITIHQELESLHESINKKGREISRMMNEVAPSFDNIISIEAKIESLVNNKNRIPYRDKLRTVALMAEDIQVGSLKSEPSDEYYRLVSSLLREMQMAPQIKEHGDLIDITIMLEQEGQDRVSIAKTDKELINISSVGLSYLLLLTVYAAITKTFKNDDSARVIWPIDELGKLHSENVRALKKILDNEGIVMFAATPESTPNTLCLFSNLYEVDKNRSLKRYIPQKSALDVMNDALGEVGHVE